MSYPFRDKDYVRTDDGLLFNVVGYDHTDTFLFGSLKYVDGKKWTNGYEAARRFLRQYFPQYVSDYIRIPCSLMVDHFSPTERWHALQRSNVRTPLHDEALQLGQDLLRRLGIRCEGTDGDPSPIGITDSLLWGTGHPASDIDLIVVGKANADRVLEGLPSLYESRDFTRPSPTLLKAPYGHRDSSWPDLLQRKLHMGVYRGRLFSLRTVLSCAEYDDYRRERKENRDFGPAVESVEFEIADATHSLMFPAIYRDRRGNELVDYSVLYEGVFRPGDHVRCRCQTERAVIGAGTCRFIIDGPCTWIA